MADYGFWQGAERATGRALTTGMQLLNLRADQMNMAKKLEQENIRTGLLKDQFAIQKRKADLEIKQIEHDQELIPASKLFKMSGITDPDEQKFFTQYAGMMIEQGPVSGEPVIQRKNLKSVWGNFLKDENAMLTLAGLKVNTANKNIVRINEILNNPESKLKEEEQNKLAAELEKWETQKTIADNSVNQYLKKKDQKRYSVSPGEALVDESGKVVYHGTEKPTKYSAAGWSGVEGEENLQLSKDDNGNVVYSKTKKPYTGGPYKSLVASTAEQTYANKIYLAAQNAGISPIRVRQGKLSKEESKKLIDVYKKEFGVEDFIQMLLSAGMTGTESAETPANKEPVIEYDATGKRVK